MWVVIVTHGKEHSHLGWAHVGMLSLEVLEFAVGPVL
jgi:hypothetical protein